MEEDWIWGDRELWGEGTQSSDCVGWRDVRAWCGEGSAMGRTVPGQQGDWGGKAGPSQVARGWGFAEEPHGGESWPKSRRRPRLVTPPIPGAGTKPDCGQAGRNQARDLVPEQQVPVRLPERLQGCSGKARPGTADPSLPQPRPLRTHSATRRSSAPAPSPAAPSSPSLGATATAS